MLYMGFNMEQFAVPLKFWFELNRLKNDEWFILTDEIIDLIGYKSSASNSTHNRASLLRFIRKHYIEGTDFMVAPICVAKNTRGGAHHKMEIKMKKHAFKSMLMSVRTEVSRTVHEYLITLEEATMKYMTYQYHCQIVATNRANAILEETLLSDRTRFSLLCQRCHQEAKRLDDKCYKMKINRTIFVCLRPNNI